jgi:hypothetical protein
MNSILRIKFNYNYLRINNMCLIIKDQHPVVGAVKSIYTITPRTNIIPNEYMNVKTVEKY